MRYLLYGLLLTGSSLFAADVPAPRPPAPPAPMLMPEVATLDGGERSESDLLAKRLRELLAGHDSRIAELLSILDGRQPAATTALPGLDEARSERAAALSRAATQAQDFVARRRTSATVAGAIAPGAASPSDTLRARNRLAIADCYRRLVMEGAGEADLEAGVTALAGIDAALLGESEMPTLFYLRAWFQGERARRHADPFQAAALASEAREAARILGRDFPHSALARTAQDLVRDLP